MNIKIFWKLHWSKIVKGLAVIFLFIVLIKFFMIGVIIQYAKKDTNFKKSLEKPSHVNLPTATFCFNPAFKKSILTKYKLSTYSVFNNLVNTKTANYSIPNLFNESSYQLNKDFNLSVWKDEKIGNYLSEGNNNVEYNETKSVKYHVEMISGIVSGLCYKVTPEYQGKADDFITYVIKLSKSLKMEDKPKSVDISLTSVNSSYGIIRNEYLEGDSYETTITNSTQMMLYLRLFQINLIHNCKTGGNYYTCLAREFQNSTKVEYSNCPRFCVPIVFKSLMELNLNKSLPICETGEENSCIYHALHEISQNNDNCERSCKMNYYIGSKKTLATEMGRQSDFELSFVMATTSVNTESEYVIYDIAGMVGSIGGSMGLFIGFSFMDFIFKIVDVFEDIINKRNFVQPT